MQGRDVGRPPVRARAPLRLRHGRAAVRRRAGGPGRVPHRASAAASSARSAAARHPAACERRSDARSRSAVARRVRRAGARLHRRPGLARGARRPRDAGVGVREAGRRPRGLPARVGRARRALGPVLVPRPRPRAHVRRARPQRRVVGGDAARGRAVRPGRARRARGAARALPRADARRAAAVPRRHRRLPRLRHRARDRAPARRAARRPRACPTRCCSLAGHVAAFDHFRQRLYLIENVYPPPGARRRRRSRALYDARGRAGSRPRSTSSAGRCRTCPRCRRPTSSTELPEVRRNFESDAVDRARSRPRRSTSSPATSSRSCSRSASTSIEPVDPFEVYRVLRLVNPSPYMYFLRHPEATIVGSSPEPMVQLLDGRVISRPIAGTRRRGRNERARPAHGGRARRAPEGARRARDARRPRPQRRRARRAASAPSRSRS